MLNLCSIAQLYRKSDETDAADGRVIYKLATVSEWKGSLIS